MKSYPTNNKKLNELTNYPLGTKFKCHNGCVMELVRNDGLADCVSGNVVYVPDHLVDQCKARHGRAVWTTSGIKEFAHDWPKGMDIMGLA